MNVLVVLNDPPYGTERSYNGLRLAGSLARRDGVPGLVCHTPLDTAIPNTMFVSFPGVHGTDLLARAPGVAASTGSACHAGESTPSATLLAMGVAPDVARSAVRLSLGRDTTGAAVALAADRLVAAWRQAREEHPVPETSKRE